MPNESLHLTAFPLRSKAAGELVRYLASFELWDGSSK